MASAMSMGNLSIDGEFRYIVQWFNEWSELQRDDFIPELVDCLNRDQSTSSEVVYMNGMVNTLANTGIADKPMSLFQCRIKLFREWTPKWSNELKNILKEKIIEIDPKVGEKVINEMKAVNRFESCNGLADRSAGNDNCIDSETEILDPTTENALPGRDVTSNSGITFTIRSSSSNENVANVGTATAGPASITDVSPIEPIE